MSFNESARIVKVDFSQPITIIAADRKDFSCKVSGPYRDDYYQEKIEWLLLATKNESIDVIVDLEQIHLYGQENL